ncbi:PadR family transcriptional regulator [Specibacter cremeus]|uniref:PadR family transcriptional regulator n=1 Tax=Specibacter cremeus TaxID=1629051 RepID=UPI000F76B273|nr:PadR family transcriptional regulator [Specibacter cremeus]
MSLPHALLTSLLEQPGSGAELARRFDKSIGYFWAATHQQIYRELAKMERRGLIAGAERDGGRGRARHYTVLAAGRRELVDWAGAAAEPRPPRDDFMVRLRAAAVLGDVDLRPEAVRHRDVHRRRLENYLDIEARDFPAGAGREGQLRLQHAVLRAGIAFERAWLEWCDELLGDGSA